MKIGNTYEDNKIYRGIRTSNGLPLLAEDLHEFSDTLAAKSNYLLESILGSGILTEPSFNLADTGIKLVSPIVINIHGDICLIANSSDKVLVDYQGLSTTNSVGTIFIVAWYQHITAQTTLKEYGGVLNNELPNDLIHPDLKFQVSTRYQLRWDIAVYQGEYSKSSFTLKIPARDENGNSLNSTININAVKSVGSIYRADVPSEMPYAIDELYIIPLMSYECIPGGNKASDIKSLESYPIQRTSSSMTMVTSTTEPTGRFSNGTVWYNPTNREFKTYVEDTGFVASASKMGFIQYQYVDIASTNVLTPIDLLYTIDVPSLEENDIIHVTYEGLELIRDTDYTINIEDRTITLLSFTRAIGEKLVVNVTRLVEANDVTSLTSNLVSHMNTNSSNTVIGHVKLSDAIDSVSGADSGIAATPKAVSESKLITDSKTDTKYKLGIEDGILYVEEV